MATHAGVEADLKADLKLVQGRQAGRSPELRTTAHPFNPPQRRGLRRIISREQGCALEMIGHAVDYLNDCYLHEGAEDEIIDFRGPTMEAIQILISIQRQVLHSLPLTEPFTQRLWNTLLRRKQPKSPAVVPLTSSR
jgi:hypothetical protein